MKDDKKTEFWRDGDSKIEKMMTVATVEYHKDRFYKELWWNVHNNTGSVAPKMFVNAEKP